LFRKSQEFGTDNDLETLNKRKEHTNTNGYSKDSINYGFMEMYRKQSGKMCTQFDEISEHLAHHEKCGPNC
jgi:hypothetical protein